MERVYTASSHYIADGAYLYSGITNSGNHFYFISDLDQDYDSMDILDAFDPEYVRDPEYIKQHRIITLTGRDAYVLVDETYRYILSYFPEGNYDPDDVLHDFCDWEKSHLYLKYGYYGSMAHCIIDLFENFLEIKGINIPNPEKREDSDHILYGSDYRHLFDITLTAILEQQCEE